MLLFRSVEHDLVPVRDYRLHVLRAVLWRSIFYRQEVAVTEKNKTVVR